MLTKEKYVPYVIETSAGLTRSVLMTLCDAYSEEELSDGDKRIVLRLHPKLAPYKIAIFPLVKKVELTEIARRIYMELCDDFHIFYDDSGTIGKGIDVKTK